MALSEENLLFLEAWRTIDRAYIDKSFNGQSWFRYREDALRNEPMNNREETCIDFILYLFTFFNIILYDQIIRDNLLRFEEWNHIITFALVSFMPTW